MALALFVIITWVPRILARFSSLPPDDGLALLSRLVEVFTFTMFAAVALTLYWRRGDDWLALFTGMMLLLTAYGYTGGRLTGTYWAFASFFLVVLMEVFQVTFFYIFPDGKFFAAMGEVRRGAAVRLPIPDLGEHLSQQPATGRAGSRDRRPAADRRRPAGVSLPGPTPTRHNGSRSNGCWWASRRRSYLSRHQCMS
ncbi:MAG: hypothetical protein IPK52_13775 [Chloroflexi bacterium]|nr:hypothetical protein [Chloroflexota bacterium]